MPILSGIYSAGDSLKRRIGGLLDDPKGTLEQFVGQLRDDMTRNSDLMNQAGWGKIDRVHYTPEQQAAARKQLADIGTNMAMSAATVWHGSPHKFDKFDSKKIGTGEGAQAYGHGLYLAESPDVARSYTASNNHISKQEWVSLDGVPYRATQTRSDDTAHNVAADALSRFDYDKKAALGWLENYGIDLEAKKIIKGLKKFGPTNDPATSMYKVDLPDEHIAKMLDWDKPLSQQHPDVRSVLRKNGISGKQWQVQAVGDGPQGYLNDRYLFDSAFDARNEINSLRSQGYSAKTFTPDASDVVTVPDLVKGQYQENYADRFKNMGIPGIRYLDGGSRGTGSGTSNFVVFPGNEDMLTILERNGKPLGLLGD